MGLAQQMLACLHDKGLEDMKVVMGGVIPLEDAALLKELGLPRFSPAARICGDHCRDTGVSAGTIEGIVVCTGHTSYRLQIEDDLGLPTAVGLQQRLMIRDGLNFGINGVTRGIENLCTVAAKRVGSSVVNTGGNTKRWCHRDRVLSPAHQQVFEIASLNAHSPGQPWLNECGIAH